LVFVKVIVRIFVFDYLLANPAEADFALSTGHLVAT
jgi:hypothetical protein